MESLQIAFLPIIRVQFDVALAEQKIQAARQALLEAKFDLVGPEKPVSSLAAAQAAIAGLSAEPIDLLVIFQATFADSTMVTSLTAGIDAPVFLWAIPEAWSGGRLRLNSLCGINLAGHALRLRGRNFEYAYAEPEDASVLRQVGVQAAAGRLRRLIRNARLGVVGEHPDGMDTCNLDEPALRAAFGFQVERISLEEVFTRARQVAPETLSGVRKQLELQIDNLADLEQKPLQGTLSVYTALKEIALERGLDGLALRCWPEFFTEMGCAACGAMSMLSDGFGCPVPIPCSCEADINGTITQLILQWLAGAPAFGTDMVAADYQKDALAIWHCGLAPFSMAQPGVQKHGGNHSNRGVPLVMDFPLKAGRVTIARLSQSGGALRLVLGQGEVLAEPKPFSGTSGVLRLSRPVQEFVNNLMKEGLEHHISIVYGDYLAELQAFTTLIGIPFLKF